MHFIFMNVLLTTLVAMTELKRDVEFNVHGYNSVKLKYYFTFRADPAEVSVEINYSRTSIIQTSWDHI